MMLAYCFFTCSLILLCVATVVYIEGDNRNLPWMVAGVLLFIIYGGFTYTVAEEHQAQLECTTHQQIEEK